MDRVEDYLEDQRFGPDERLAEVETLVARERSLRLQAEASEREHRELAEALRECGSCGAS